MTTTQFLRALALALCLPPVAGCATIVEGTDQSVAVSTDPSGASCELLRDGHPIAFVNPTPGSATVTKSAKDVIVKCRKDGHDDEVAPLASKFQGMTLGNVIIGGLIGVGIDAASGAMNHYPESVNIPMTPSAFASVEERDAFYAARRDRIAADVQKAVEKIRAECAMDAAAHCEADVTKLEGDRDAKLREIEARRLRAAVASK